MAKLFGTEYSKKDLLKRVGDISQVGGVRLHTLADGVERGVRTVDVRTGSGLNFTVVVDRGMDISTAEYKGQSLAWRSSTGDVSPSFYEEPGLGWLRSFSAGLVVTCGLTYAGAPCVDQGKPLGLHGRVSNIPASNVYADAEWQGDDYVMWVQGKVRETAMFGENIEMERRITAKLGEPKLCIHDKITNLGFQDTEHMLIYHCNMGFPVVDGGSKLIAPVRDCISRDADAEAGKEHYTSFPEPIQDFREQCYYLDIAEDSDGNVKAALANPGFNNEQGFGIYMKYPKKELPSFTEWKMTGEGFYVVGMEPANCRVESRAKERERGTLQFLQPGETLEYHLEIGVLSSNDEIKAFEASL